MGLKEDLDILDTKINKVKVDYEGYFAGILKREPAALREEIDRLIFKYADRLITNTALKFRYSAITSKYASYKQFWDRILREIENGTYARGAAFGAKPSGASAQREPRREELIGDRRIKALYREYREAIKKSNELSKEMTYKEFSKAIIQQTEKIKSDYRCRDVDCRIAVKDGKTKITFIPIK